MICIVPSQGFGDWIIVNPIVRILSKKCKIVLEEV